jgi:Na+/proline symporter/signal transduction histidine kinase
MLNILIGVCLLYVLALFLVAFWAERSALRGRGRWLRSPWVYTLSLSIYCTAWTFYGAVGYAARSGLEYLTIYLGPSLVMFGWWWILRRLVRVGRTQRVTSIADLLSSRFGKSNLLAALVTLLAVVGTTPYIALQLQSVTLSFSAFAEYDATAMSLISHDNSAIIVALGLAFFTILFGTRNLDVNERHHGVVMAIAVEAIVKLFALIAVGVFVVWGVSGGFGAMIKAIDQSALVEWKGQGSRWFGLTFLSAAAFLCLPRMFQVLVVENENERHLMTASWAFPTYVMLMSLFVVPIAVVGRNLLPDGSNPDLFVLSIPLSQGNDTLAVLSFLGGFSSATSMVIVASLALATMVSNHVVMPVWLRFTENRASEFGDVRRVITLARRSSIAFVLFLGYLYYSMSGGGEALASIGLVSFTGVVQVLPSMMGGLFWRGATRAGAISGIVVGFVVWVYCLFLPSFGHDLVFSKSFMDLGPYGLAFLRPQALFGITGMDPLVHAIFWSMILNTASFVLISLITFPSPIERLQGAQFVNVFHHSTAARGWSGKVAQSEDLMVMSQRIIGSEQAQNLFRNEARRQGGVGYLPDPTPEFLERLERELAGSVGAATAHAMIAQIVGGTSVSVQDLMAVADETAQIMEYSNRLEAQSNELTRTARQLRQVNEKLTRLSVQKDAFLSQISHELRTPMTSILAFSEILQDGDGLSDDEMTKYASIIHGEATRLTRLLDDLLDLSVLENGQVNLNLLRVDPAALIDRAIATVQAGSGRSNIAIKFAKTESRISLITDPDRLSQVFINLIANARKYCDAQDPELLISMRQRDNRIIADFIDNGSGVPNEDQELIFEKFARVGENKAGGAGLGLAICREIIGRLGGEISYLPGQGGGAFRIILPLERS